MKTLTSNDSSVSLSLCPARPTMIEFKSEVQTIALKVNEEILLSNEKTTPIAGLSSVSIAVLVGGEEQGFIFEELSFEPCDHDRIILTAFREHVEMDTHPDADEETITMMVSLPSVSPNI